MPISRYIVAAVVRCSWEFVKDLEPEAVAVEFDHRWQVVGGSRDPQMRLAQVRRFRPW
jgi:hypothetical protein